MYEKRTYYREMWTKYIKRRNSCSQFTYYQGSIILHRVGILIIPQWYTIIWYSIVQRKIFFEINHIIINPNVSVLSLNIYYYLIYEKFQLYFTPCPARTHSNINTSTFTNWAYYIRSLRVLIIYTYYSHPYLFCSLVNADTHVRA